MVAGASVAERPTEADEVSLLVGLGGSEPAPDDDVTSSPSPTSPTAANPAVVARTAKTSQVSTSTVRSRMQTTLQERLLMRR